MTLPLWGLRVVLGLELDTLAWLIRLPNPPEGHKTTKSQPTTKKQERVKSEGSATAMGRDEAVKKRSRYWFC